MRAHRVFTLLALCALAAPAVVLAQAPVISSVGLGPSQEEIGPGDPFPSLYFGATVAVAGSIAMASIPGETAVDENEFGRVAVFEKLGEQWRRTATLIGAEESGGGFGSAIDIEGHRAVITASRALYLFERRGAKWVQTAKVLFKSPEVFVGKALALEQDRIAVTIHGAGNGSEAVVHVYRQTPGRAVLSRTAVLRQPGIAADAFGTDLAMERRLLVVGAPATTGMAFVYFRVGERWYWIDTLMASDSAPGEGFGSAVAVRNGVIVVGAPEADLGVEDPDYVRLRGDVYVFTPHRQSWYESQKLSDEYDPYFLTGVGGQIAIGKDLLALKRKDTRGLTRGEDRVLVFDWVNGRFEFGRQVARYEGSIPDIDMCGRRLIFSTHEGPLFSYYVLGHASILTFGRQPVK